MTAPENLTDTPPPRSPETAEHELRLPLVTLVASAIGFSSAVLQFLTSGPTGVWLLLAIFGSVVLIAGIGLIRNVRLNTRISVAATAVGAVTATLGIVGILGWPPAGKHDSPSHPRVAASPSANPVVNTGTPMTTSTASATLTSPPGNTRVSASQGFKLGGKVTNLGQETIWIIDSDGGYTVDAEAVVIGNSWTAVNDNLEGSGKTIPFSVTTLAYLASPSCATSLERIENSSANYAVDLPAGCRAFGQVNVTVSKP